MELQNTGSRLAGAASSRWPVREESRFTNLAFGTPHRSRSLSRDNTNSNPASSSASENKADQSGMRKRRNNPFLNADLEARMTSHEFLSMSEADKFGEVGRVLNSLRKHNNKTDRLISDLSHQYSKYCLRMSGPDLRYKENEDSVNIWIEAMAKKYGIVIKEEERAQFRACHKMADGYIVAAFTTSIPGSVFDRCVFRGDRGDGKGTNWNGELGQPPYNQLKISVDRLASRADKSIMSAALFLKRKEKDCPPE